MRVSSRPRGPRILGAGLCALAMLLAGCSSSDDTGQASDGPSADSGQDQKSESAPAAVPSSPLRADERFVDLKVAEPYKPSAPYGTGTDDYRCFLLDPELAHRAFVTGVNVLPGDPSVVHHVILFRVEPSEVSAAEELDEQEDGEGWTCFGGTGLSGNAGTGGLDRAPWLAGWAPGGGESLMKPGIGIPLEPGSRVIMQVHYNLLAGDPPDQSAAQLRMAPGDADLRPLDTILIPAPVELPCRPDHDDDPLCHRQTAINDVIQRFGPQAGYTVSGLQLLCGEAGSRPGPTQFCDRRIERAGTIQAVAGHMHLLGKSISIELNPGRPSAKTLLDIPVWDFDDQRAVPLKTPVRVSPGDTIRVTCTHTQRLHDQLPSFEGQPERYVVWGEGTTDEMCLGILLFTPR